MYYIFIKFLAFPKLLLDSPPPFTTHLTSFSLFKTNKWSGGGEESQNRQTKEKKEKESLLGKSQVAIFFFFKSKQRNADSTLSRQSLLVGQTENRERAGAIIN